jgi:alpha-glucosidase (family GH31 glycosyl hydrolase)
MQRSVTEVMMKNMFGVPFAGANICGYYDTDSNVNTAQLCARWHQLGALQPFSRQHTGCASPRKDPGMFANIMVPGLNGVSYTDIMRDAILTKYSLQRYFYSELFKISVLNAGVGTIYKPLFFSFPNDQMAYTANPSENVMIGPSLKLSIKTTPVNNTVSDTNMYYFPKGSWCDILHPMDVCVVSDGTNMQRLKAGVQDFQLHLKDGEILVYQNASEIASNATRFPKGLRSEYMQEMPVDLHIHPTDVSTDRNKTVRY